MNLPWNEIVSFALAFLSARYGAKLMSNARVRKVAKQMLASTDHPATDITQAIREAWVLMNHEHIAEQVEKLKLQQAQGKLEVNAFVQRAADASRGVVESTIVPLDGTEEWK